MPPDEGLGLPYTRLPTRARQVTAPVCARSVFCTSRVFQRGPPSTPTPFSTPNRRREQGNTPIPISVTFATMGMRSVWNDLELRGAAPYVVNY